MSRPFLLQLVPDPDTGGPADPSRWRRAYGETGRLAAVAWLAEEINTRRRDPLRRLDPVQLCFSLIVARDEPENLKPGGYPREWDVISVGRPSLYN